MDELSFIEDTSVLGVSREEGDVHPRVSPHLPSLCHSKSVHHVAGEGMEEATALTSPHLEDWVRTGVGSVCVLSTMGVM